VPPPNVTVCCVPDGDESECAVLTPDHCAAAHGTASDAMSCESDPCGHDSGGDGGGGGDHGGDDDHDGGDSSHSGDGGGD
jgi:hypothetical protein